MNFLEIELQEINETFSETSNEFTQSNNSSSSLHSSFEIPSELSSDFFQPLLQQTQQPLSLITLPPEILQTISSHLDFDSFIQLTSTCKTLQKLEENQQVVRSVCEITDNQTTIEECIESVKNRKRQNKIEQHRLKELQREKLKRRKNGFILCNRRCSSNIFLELLSLLFIYLAIGIGAASFDRFIDVPLKCTAFLLLFPTIFY